MTAWQAGGGSRTRTGWTPAGRSSNELQSTAPRPGGSSRWPRTSPSRLRQWARKGHCTPHSTPQAPRVSATLIRRTPPLMASAGETFRWKESHDFLQSQHASFFITCPAAFTHLGLLPFASHPTVYLFLQPTLPQDESRLGLVAALLLFLETPQTGFSACQTTWQQWMVV